MQTRDIWSYGDEAWGAMDLTGYSVEALDGSIGKIDEATNELGATNEVGARYIVVDTGPWIFGKKVFLPAGVIDSVDAEDTCVFVQRTKDEIKNAPEFDADMMKDSGYREQFGSYYGPGGAGHYSGPREFSRRVGTQDRS
jgi:hypothetical protein